MKSQVKGTPSTEPLGATGRQGWQQSAALVAGCGRTGAERGRVTTEKMIFEPFLEPMKDSKAQIPESCKTTSESMQRTVPWARQGNITKNEGKEVWVKL